MSYAAFVVYCSTMDDWPLTFSISTSSSPSLPSRSLLQYQTNLGRSVHKKPAISTDTQHLSVVYALNTSDKALSPFSSILPLLLPFKNVRSRLPNHFVIYILKIYTLSSSITQQGYGRFLKTLYGNRDASLNSLVAWLSCKAPLKCSIEIMHPMGLQD